MGTVEKLPEAKADLRTIIGRIAEDNVPAAFNWLDEIEAVFRLLSTQPFLGQALHTNRLGSVRRHVFGSYVIYYQPIPDGVQIRNVIHAARDQDQLV